MKRSFDRRDFLTGSAGFMATALFGGLPLEVLMDDAAPSTAQDWDAGLVRHLLPSVSDSRILLKTSFERSLSMAPTLEVGTNRVPGRQNDTSGEYWQFYATDLEPDHSYTLSLRAADGTSLCEPWTLSTFPSRDARPNRFRVLFFTCAGGVSGSYSGIFKWDVNTEPLDAIDRMEPFFEIELA